MEPIRCLDCGFPLDMYYDAFLYLKAQLQSKDVHVDKRPLDMTTTETLIPIFEKLKIYKYCCRGQLATCVTMSSMQ